MVSIASPELRASRSVRARITCRTWDGNTLIQAARRCVALLTSDTVLSGLDAQRLRVALYDDGRNTDPNYRNFLLIV